MHGIAEDVRQGLRVLRRDSISSLLAIVSVALGIGANIAIFSLLNALLLRPLSGVRAPERLVRIDVALPSTILEDLAKEPVFAGACGVSTPLITTEFHGEVEPVGVLALTGECPAVLGIKAHWGRMLTPADDRDGTPKVAVLIEGFWRGRFGGRPEAIGSTIRIDGVPFTIVGVADSDFHGVLMGFQPGIVVSAGYDPSDAHISHGKRPYSIANIFARLNPTVSIEQAQARLTISQERLLDESAPLEYQGARRQEFISQKLKLLSAANGLDYMLRNQYSRPLGVALGISVLVLLVSCVNLANLLLARGVRRRRDIALRLAIGASRTWIVRQLTIESMLLLVSGSFAGLALAYAADRVLITQVHDALVNFSLAAPLDARVLAFAVMATLVTGIGFGVIPAWRISDVNLIEVLKEPNRGVRGGSTARLLIAAQIALTLALVAATGLFVSSLERLRNAPLGLRVENVVEAQLFPVPDGYKDMVPETYYRDLLEDIEAMPGVESASYSNFAPLFSSGYSRPVRFTDDATRTGVTADANWVSDRFLSTLSIPLIAGRDFGRMEGARQPRTAVVSQSLARRLSPANEIIGRHIRFGSEPEDQDLEVIGIAADVRLKNVRAAGQATIYINLWQYSYSAKYGVLLVKRHNLNAGFIQTLERTVRGAHREYVQMARTLEEQRDNALLPERLLAWLSSAFGVLALTLASTGLYGLMMYYVASRTGEIGIRMALGATSPGVQRLVLGEALRLAAMGCAVGLLLALATGRFIGALLYDVRPFEPAYFTIALVVLLATSGAAAWVPAYRASRIDPLSALRHE